MIIPINSGHLYVGQPAHLDQPPSNNVYLALHDNNRQASLRKFSIQEVIIQDHQLHLSTFCQGMSATASGSNAKLNGDAANRNHNQGNQARKYTEEQKAAVIRVRKCAHTAFYEILGIEKSVSEGDIKKAYRKLSLLTHPDKNGYDGADEAFKSRSISSSSSSI